jgi:hypothetical protein
MNGQSVLLLSTVWPARALLRAQLMESGLEAVATDTLVDARLQMLERGLPRVFILDLQELPDPASTLRELGTIVPAERILVLATLTGAAGLDGLPGVRVLRRPIAIRAVIETAERMRRTARS